MTALASFDEFYVQELRPALEQLESERKQFVTSQLKSSLPLLLIGAAVFILSQNQLIPEELAWIGGAAAIGGLIWFVVKFYQFSKSFKPRFKDQIVKRIIHHIDNNLEYEPHNCIDRHTYMQSGIYPKHPDRYKGEDLIYGLIDKTTIRFSELHSEYKTTTTDSNGNRKTTWHTIFKGIFFEASFNKSFKTKTYVLPDTLEKTFGFLGKKLQSWNMSRPPLVKLEDPEFEKEYAVYGEDQVESRYILSTTLMEKLTEFQRKTHTRVALSFVNNHVYIGIPQDKNLFEPRYFRSNLNEAFIKEYHQILELTIGIVDDLNLNRKIWGTTMSENID